MKKKKTSPTTPAVFIENKTALSHYAKNAIDETIASQNPYDKVTLTITNTSCEIVKQTPTGVFKQTILMENYQEASYCPTDITKEGRTQIAQALIDKGYTQKEVAERLGRSQSWVSNNTTR